jgi:hypothetical protein
MSLSLQRTVLIALGGVWVLLLAFRLTPGEPPQEVPLTFVSGRSAAKKTSGAPDPWQVKPMAMQAKAMSETPKKNIFAPLGESTVVGDGEVGASAGVTNRRKRVSPPPPVVVVAEIPPAPSGPTPEELAEQAAKQQEDLRRKQAQEQMGQYRYLGYLTQQGVQKAFVGKGKDIYIIRQGDKLDGKFLVASINATTVKLKEPVTSLEASLDLKKETEQGPS